MADLETSAGALDAEGLEVAGAVRELALAVGLSRWYGPHHPRVAAAADRALEELRPLIRQRGSLRLATTPDSFLWRGHPVHRDPADGRGFARLLHGEGVCELRLEAAIDLDSLLAFFAVLRLNLDLDVFEEETLEMLLWQADLEGISVQMVPELGDAEMLSGRLASEGRFALSEYEDEVAHPSRANDERRALDRLEAQIAAGDAFPSLRELMNARPELPEDLKGDPGRDEWSRKLRELGTLRAVEELVEGVEGPTDGQHLARLCTLLFQIAGEERSEMPPEHALARAREALDAIYAFDDVFGLARVYGDATRLGKAEAQGLARGGREAVTFLTRACRPAHIVTMLAGGDAEDPAFDQAARDLLGALPESDLQAVLESTAHQRRDIDLEPVLLWIARTAGERVLAWFEEGLRQPADRLAPIIELLRIAGHELPPGRLRHDRRAELIGHPSPRVRMAALRWDQADPDRETRERILGRLLDTDRDVRMLASEAVIDADEPEAQQWFLARLDSTEFTALPEEIRESFCVAFGRAAGRAAAPRLIERLRAADSLRVAPHRRRIAQDAAMVLVASGDPRALAVVEQEAATLHPGRRSAARRALRSLARIEAEDGREKAPDPGAEEDLAP